MKIAITLLTILALAVAAFFVGWVELSLPPGTYGVAFTKSGGWDEAAVAPGGVTWRWERLIPTNMTLHLFDLAPQEVQRRVAALLPSADVYAAEIGIDPAALSGCSFARSTWRRWRRRRTCARTPWRPGSIRSPLPRLTLPPVRCCRRMPLPW